MHQLLWKRVYVPAQKSDGYRILVDRLWPRGLSKEAAALDEWAKQIAPSTPLRQAFHRGEMVYGAFAASYQKELNNNPDLPEFIALVKQHLKKENVTLLYGSKNPDNSDLPTLRLHVETALGIQSALPLKWA